MPPVTTKPRSTRSKGVETQIDLPGVIAKIDDLNAKVAALLANPKSIGTSLPKPTPAVATPPPAPQEPVVVRIPAGRNFQIITVPEGEAGISGITTAPVAAPVAKPTKLTPEAFVQLLFQASNDMDQENLSAAFDLAARRGLNIVRYATAVHGVLYHNHHSYLKLSRESSGRKTKPRKSRKKEAAATESVTDIEAQTNQDIALLRGQIREFSLTPQAQPKISPAVELAFQRLSRLFHQLSDDHKKVFETYVQCVSVS